MTRSAPADGLLQLDAYRGLSALVVLAGHLAQVFWMPFVGPASPLVPFFATLSRHAVLVFFLLSGYFIAQSLRRNARANGGLFDAAEFAIARAARLYPPLLGALLLTAACVAAAGALGRGSIAVPQWTLQAGGPEYARALLFVGGLEGANPVLWSLNIEACLYLLAGVLAWTATRRRWLHPAAIGAVLLAAFSLWYTPGFAVFGAVWLLGATAALAPPGLARLRRGLSWAALAVFAALLVLAPGLLAVNAPDALAVAAGQLLAAVAYSALLFDLRLPRALLAAPARSAAFSYTLYLVHWPLLVLALALLHPTVSQQPAWAAAATAGGGACALAVAWAMARGLERPAWFAAHMRALAGRAGPNPERPT